MPKKAADELVAEVFAVGKWNGMEFGLADLQDIAANFAKFNDVLKVPLKMGHNKEQPMTDGKPALGWVTDVWVEGSKLMAKFSDVPAIVMDALKKKLYRKVSVELDLDVKHKGEQHPFVLSAVALLGADIPAVSTLSDLDAFLARRAAFSAGRRACFDAVAGNITTEEYDMDLKELSDKVVALTSQVAALTTENADLKNKVTGFEAERAQRLAAEKATLMSAKRTQVNGIFDEAVKAGKLTPAQKSIFAKTMKLEDDAAMESLDIEDVKALCASSTSTFSKDTAAGAGAGGSKADDRAPDVIITERAHALIAEGKAANFAAAQSQVLAADPDLGKRYMQQSLEG
jgi:regulator of replication initiation timing